MRWHALSPPPRAGSRARRAAELHQSPNSILLFCESHDGSPDQRNRTTTRDCTEIPITPPEARFGSRRILEATPRRRLSPSPWRQPILLLHLLFGRAGRILDRPPTSASPTTITPPRCCRAVPRRPWTSGGITAVAGADQGAGSRPKGRRQDAGRKKMADSGTHSQAVQPPFWVGFSILSTISTCLLRS